MACGRSNLVDLKSRKFWTALFAELVGTALLTMFACATTEDRNVSKLHIAIGFGFTVASVISVVGRISGGHVNPSVTIGFLITRRISLVRGLMYIAVQTVGGIIGAGLLMVLTPENSNVVVQGLGAVGLADGVTVGQGFGIELITVFLFVLVIFSVVDSQRQDVGGSVPLIIGVALALGHLWAVVFTGAGMNPARALGPALMLNKWENQWLYWAGPLVGGMAAGLLYEFVFAVNATPAKLVAFFTKADYDTNQFDSVGRRLGVDANSAEMK